MTESTTENYQLNLGSLRSQVELKLHTYHAVRVWQGKKNSDGHSTPGMSVYFSITNLIKMASARNDPYADWWMIQIEEKLETAQEQMKDLTQLIDKLIEKIPTQITITDNLNQKPFSTPLFVGSHMGFRGVYLLEAYDSLARKILLANHTGLLSRRDTENYLDQGAHLLRSLFGLAKRYSNAGVSRDDMAASNAKARAAIDKYGLPPQDILDGSRRSDFAPALIGQRTPESAADDNATEVAED